MLVLSGRARAREGRRNRGRNALVQVDARSRLHDQERLAVPARAFGYSVNRSALPRHPAAASEMVRDRIEMFLDPLLRGLGGGAGNGVFSSGGGGDAG